MDSVKEFLKKNWFDTLFLIIIAIVAYNFTSNMAILHINGQSMFPTYSDGDIVLMRKQEEKNYEDIVIFSSPESWTSDLKSKDFIKRLVAKEGDTVKYEDNYVTVNGERPIFIDRNFCELDKAEVTLGENQYFVMGDNSSNSNDSLTQLCLNNEEFYIQESSILTSGYELFSIRNFRRN